MDINHHYHPSHHPLHHHHHHYHHHINNNINPNAAIHYNNQYNLPSHSSSMIFQSAVPNNTNNYANCLMQNYSIQPHSTPISSYIPYKSTNQQTIIRNLRLKMHEIHLSYINNTGNNINANGDCDHINNDETKLKLRKKLENLINEYLTLVSNVDKFTFKEFHDCIESSCKKVNFDPEKCIEAFELLEKYALNLLNYPWRHEYHKIFAFGYFRIIKYSLCGYNELLQLFGYSYNSQSDIYMLNELPIDPDKMIAIAFDCLVSIVEIKIMLEIKINSMDKILWSDINSIRNKYICDVEMVLKILNDLKQNKNENSDMIRLMNLDIDLKPDYSMKKFEKIDLLSPINHNNNNKTKFIDENLILPPPPPPSNYLESDLDRIDYIDSQPSSSSASAAVNEQINHTFITPKLSTTAPRTVRKIIVKSSNLKEQKSSSPPSYEQSQKFINTLSKETSTSNTIQNSRLIDLDHECSSSNAVDKRIDDHDDAIDDDDDDDDEIINGWSCTSCTYVNNDTNEICQMCNRSRKKGNESTPLITGGRQCNKCTLVNDKKEKYCIVCGTSLADSPTYI